MEEHWQEFDRYGSRWRVHGPYAMAQTIASADVTVVGAGIVGSLIAREAVQSGQRTLLVDAAFPGAGVTAEGMGHLLVLDDSPLQLQFTAYARDQWRVLSDQLPDDVEYRQTGTLWVAEPEDETIRGEKTQALLDHGVEAESWAQSKLMREEPLLSRDLAGAVWVPDDAVLYAPRATAWAAASSVFLCAEVASVEPGRAVTSVGIIESQVIIVAAGNGCNRFFSGLGLRPRKGHLAITTRGFRVSSRQIIELGYLRSAHGTLEDSVAFNLQPRATGQTLIGSSRQFGKEHREIDCDILSRMLHRAVRFVPSLADLPILRAWTGFRPTTVTGYPLIGPIQGAPGVLVATGHEGLGIATAPATAKLIAHHLGWSRCPLDPEPFLPTGVCLA